MARLGGLLRGRSSDAVDLNARCAGLPEGPREVQDTNFSNAPFELCPKSGRHFAHSAATSERAHPGAERIS